MGIYLPALSLGGKLYGEGQRISSLYHIYLCLVPGDGSAPNSADREAGFPDCLPEMPFAG